MVFPSTPCISKFLFSIPERNQELFSNHLLELFLQNLSLSSCMDSRQFVFCHLAVSADQYNGGVLLAAKCKNVFRVSITKSVRPLWETAQKNDVGNQINYELHLWKMDCEAAYAVIIQLKLSFTSPMFWAFGIWKQGWFLEHRNQRARVHLLLSWTLNGRKLNCERSSGL